VFVLDNIIVDSPTVRRHFKSFFFFRYLYYRHGPWAYAFSYPLFLHEFVHLSLDLLGLFKIAPVCGLIGQSGSKNEVYLMFNGSYGRKPIKRVGLFPQIPFRVFQFLEKVKEEED